ncbi:MAG: hypothetical protein K8R79_10875 [Calditrichales bacterium]|nr:hypothetical protein [Calditrichales bacterium]
MDNAAANLQKTKALRQPILKKAFEGELTSQWRKDHPEPGQQGEFGAGSSGTNQAEKTIASMIIPAQV